MVIGKTLWFSKERGYGFIDVDGIQHFAHWKEIQGEGFKYLREGESVEFIPLKGEKGMLAKSIRKSSHVA